MAACYKTNELSNTPGWKGGLAAKWPKSMAPLTGWSLVTLSTLLTCTLHQAFSYNLF